MILIIMVTVIMIVYMLSLRKLCFRSVSLILLHLNSRSLIVESFVMFMCSEIDIILSWLANMSCVSSESSLSLSVIVLTIWWFLHTSSSLVVYLYETIYCHRLRETLVRRLFSVLILISFDLPVVWSLVVASTMPLAYMWHRCCCLWSWHIHLRKFRS